MNEIEFEDAILGHVVVTFDGAVLSSSVRAWARRPDARAAPRAGRAERPGPEGNYTADFCPTKRGGFKLTVPDYAWPQVTGLIEALGRPRQG